MNVLFALKVVPGYLVSGLKMLPQDVRAFVITMPKGTHPSECALPENVVNINRMAMQSVEDVLKALGASIPDIFVCCGWADFLYLKLARRLRTMGCKTVLAIDTPWRGDMRQFVNVLISRFSLVTKFDYAWGSGTPQEKYLLRMGFKRDKVRKGYYSADTEKFDAVYKEKKGRISHNFLYVGRYVPEKNMHNMELAFLAAIREMGNCDWHLTCIGNGPLWNKRIIDSRIHHLGYKSPDVIQDYILDSGCFVLPSLYEPWGVVVHEFATVGIPMICSNKVNATTAYLKDGENGFLFDPTSVVDMRDAFIKIMTKTDAELELMGVSSRKLGLSYTTRDWVDRLMSFI